MRAAVLHEYGHAPALDPAHAAPTATGPDTAVAEVLAAPLNPVDHLLALGTHPSGAPPLPSVVGREAVVRLHDGTTGYVAGPVAPWGTFADRTLVRPASLLPVPDGLDPALAASLGIAGMAASLGLARGDMAAGMAVLVLGATGVVGSLAVQLARLQGARCIVAAGRDTSGLARAELLGADLTVVLSDDAAADIDALADRLRAAAGGDGFDLVFDPLWGAPAAAAMSAMAPRGRLVHVGKSAGPVAPIGSDALRGRNLDIRGHSNHNATPAARADAYARLTAHALAGELTMEIDRLPLDAVEQAWPRARGGGGRKLVLIP